MILTLVAWILKNKVKYNSWLCELIFNNFIELGGYI